MDHEKRVVQFLSRRDSYPHPVGKILRRQTHVSHVFLAGGFAYKLKKPVKFPFLDASTLKRRKQFCRLELSLNRRLAPAVYLGIAPIVETPGGLQLGGRGRVIEWVVKMRRLPEDQMLDQLVRRRRVSRRDMVRVADRLIPFFKRAARSKRIGRYGTPPSVSQLVLGNLRECQPFVGSLLPQAHRQFLEAAYRQYLALHEPLLARRVKAGWILDGHGDLRCENICLTDPVSIFDCVEFQPAFRCGDVVNDLSFLLMDLEFRGRRDLAQALALPYRRRLRDPDFDRLLPFYECHRSLVRGKVRGLAWLQHPRTAQGRRARELSRRHFRLAVQYAKQFSRPRLIVVGGLIGTGKSTLARSLAQALGAVWLRTDEIRLRKFAHLRRPRQGFAEGLYATHVSELVYQRLIRRAEALVREGCSVICDGMFSKAVGRQQLRQIARQHGASFHFFECAVPRTVALKRVAARYAGKTDLSEAKPEHYDRLRRGFEPVRGWGARDWTRLSDDRPPTATFQAALAVLRRVFLL
ncbi:MAG: AAA family ATPase [Candidatus Omnitrophica bacterium]|nr:AAA family ATPase [Candidatus Omnitrophota bacterium]